MAEDTAPTPVFQIQRIYLKDLSLEQPNSPQILLEQQQPQVEINLNLAADPIADGMYEVCVTATVTTKVATKTLFLIEAKQAGIFEIRNLPQEQVQPIVGIACPQIVPARDRVRRLHARRLPAGHAVGSELPGDVRGAAPAGRGCQRQRQRLDLGHHHLGVIRPPRDRRPGRCRLAASGA